MIKFEKVIEEVINNEACRTIDKIEQAIQEKDLEKISELHKENVEGKQGFHDFAVRWVNLTLKYLHKYGGDEAVLDCMKEYAQTFYPPVIREWIDGYEKDELEPKDFPFEEFIKNRATLWQMVHDNIQEWHVDEDKITFILDPCNSGGYLVSECADEVVKTDKAHNWTYDRKFQCYCLNCTTMWEFGWYEWYGWPLFVMEVPEVGSDGKCKMVMYKDPSNIPDEYYDKRNLTRKI